MLQSSSIKTTIDIPEPLLDQARAEARARGTTLRELVNDGLRALLAAHDAEGPYRYEPVIFDGELGVAPGVDLANWDEIRALIYERGG
jgi:hypothetical protein